MLPCHEDNGCASHYRILSVIGAKMAVVEKLQAFFVELTSAKSSIVIRPATKSPILISMNTIGLGSFRNILLLSMVANSPACRRFSARRKMRAPSLSVSTCHSKVTLKKLKEPTNWDFIQGYAKTRYEK